MNEIPKLIISASQELDYYDQLHQEKYRDQGQSFLDHCRVTAKNLASNELHGEKIFEALIDRRFLPAGRVQAALGATEREVSPFNCSVSQRIDDSMDSIMAALGNAAKILRLGTGIGYNFSHLRPRGADIVKLKTQSSGPLSFMKIFDVMASTIASSGHRRGAQMGIMNCFSGETKVHTLKGKIAIKDLVGANPILYCVKNNKIAVEKAVSIYKSGTERVITVVLDNDTEITCTPDHLFMLSNGQYVEACKLKPNTSLMAIKKKLANNYLHVGCTGMRNTRPEHIIVYESLCGEIIEGNDVHHKDFNNHNNDPENLVSLTRKEHMEIHGGIVFEQHRKRVASDRKGKTLEQWLGPKRAALVRANMRVAKKKQAEEKGAWNKGLTGKDYTSRYKNGFSNQYTTDVDDELDEIFDKVENHKVLRIEDRGEICDVYDVTMPNTHNFFVEEVCVHNCDHPDIEAFIDAKMVKDSYRQFNLSVGITDKFMSAVERNEDWKLEFDGRLYNTVPARYLWEKITKNAYYSAEPGIIFIDRLNSHNNLHYCEHMEATNPCAEQPLPPYGLCLLGSFNLVAYLQRIDANQISLNYPAFVEDIKTFVEAYDNIFDNSIYAIPEHKEEAINKRRMGLGLTGIANAIELMVGRPCYGEPDFCAILNNISGCLTNWAYNTSADLAKTRGAFNLYDGAYNDSKFIHTLSPEVRDKIKATGIRNSHLISYAPCGTISQCAGNVSSGVEPVFYASMSRKVHMKEGQINVTLNDYNVRHHGFLGKTLEQCSIQDHLAVAEIIQKHTDSAVSKTVNVASNCSYAEYEGIYKEAYKLGLKGLTVYRPSELRGSVISEAKKEVTHEKTFVDAHCANGQCSM